MNRIKDLTEAKALLAALCARYPDASVVTSMQTQLDYLIDLESGVITDHERLDEIILGVQAAREIEPRDQDVANKIYQIVDIVEEMKAEVKARR